MIGFLTVIGCLIFLCLFFLIMAIVMNIPAYFDWEDDDNIDNKYNEHNSDEN